MGLIKALPKDFLRFLLRFLAFFESIRDFWSFFGR